MKHRSYPTLVAAAGLALVLSARGSGGTSSGSGDPLTDGTFRFALQADPGALNPIMSASAATGEISRLAYDYLIYQDPDTSEVGPWLAEKWEGTPTSASFTIREGVTCTDGSALTPHTVADNINFVADPDNGSQQRGTTVPAEAVATADPVTRTVTVTTAVPSPSKNSFKNSSTSGGPRRTSPASRSASCTARRTSSSPAASKAPKPNSQSPTRRCS
ncbi:ABC transporter substrate-binding protein [Rhodococcus erythropolis]|uniref:ABC transporter substrate-binding protein n=1 Tax=Rhodococcus erythropolis TaxID=1833 RepID=UPI001E468DAA|nr:MULTISPECIES: ABC transporter substrate-binding protein [Rhodococcus erythropolis group]MCD2109292.1 ABC transporter substrate-binding protein [Rhodococcus qingshengii]MCZ4528216.1 ABC transporter substrate-binding protein [Rhodococcus erythropolis]